MHVHAHLKPFTPARQQRAHASTPAAARLGGGGNYSGGNPDPPRLIIPGQESGSTRPGGRLVLPGQPKGPGPSGFGGGTAPARPGGGSSLDSAPAVQQQFRPPPGFMDSEGPSAAADEAADPGMSTDEMLNRLRSLTGHWYDLAKYLPALQRAGWDAMSIEEATGLERKTQNVWNTAVQVYDSIRAPGVLHPDALAHYDNEGEFLLYELRFLAVRQRAAVAAYVAERNLSPQDCQVLSKAVKEHERRDGRKEGFTESPGDVLAYKHYRDAMECRRKDEIEACAKRGLRYADSEEAIAKLTTLLGEEEGGRPSIVLPTAILTMLRMSRDELGFRPLAVAGSLPGASCEQVLAAPKVSSEGVFGNFTVPAHGVQHEWVALPNWSLLTLAVHPVALMLRNCIDIPAIRAASSAKTEEDMKRMTGQGVLVADIGAEIESLQPEKYYLGEDASGEVQLMTGDEAMAAARVLGTVLFVCRPPSRDSQASSTSELMSL
ncbi:hypothetical protein D9Q98_000619 [Chlorella vulgaris]|uniref:Uncharacterized protein n=1 Tax=Chlorella vulgaris TaxID=3077 RepID=A0A9D4TYR5_CHLVU|nr:hypothetical protein D9Q98_000619 [Chlorella vulgaris]